MALQSVHCTIFHSMLYSVQHTVKYILYLYLFPDECWTECHSKVRVKRAKRGKRRRKATTPPG